MTTRKQNQPGPDSAAVQACRQFSDPPEGQPRPEWIRGTCPLCGSPIVSNVYHVGGRGYLTVWECWYSINAEPTCTYRKVL